MEKTEEKVKNLIANFLISNKQIPNKILNAALANFPLSNDDPRLKKAILLRTIDFETNSNRDVSEKILDYLEIIEEIDHQCGKTASDSMKQAYCDVAVDCTVRIICVNCGKYVEAIERIWKDRVCRMDGLVSKQSKTWLSWIESAVDDGNARERILAINTRYVALSAVKAYLKEAWEPSFLEMVAMKCEDVVQGLGGFEVDVDADNGGMEEQVPVKNKHVGSAKISNADDEDVVVEPLKGAIDVPTHIDKVQEALKSNSVQLHDSLGVPLPDASRRAHSLPLTKEANNVNEPTIVVHEPAPELHAAPVVNTVQEAFETNSQELHNTTMDPLPEAHLTAQAALENKTGQGHSISRVDTEQQAAKSSFPEESVALKSVHSDFSKLVSTERNPVQPEVHAPAESSIKVNKNEKLTGDIPLEFQHLQILPKKLTASHVAEHGVNYHHILENRTTGMEEQVPIKNKHSGSAKNSNSNADDEDVVVEPLKGAIDVPTHVDKVQEALKSNSVQLNDSVGDPLADASRRAHSLPHTEEANNINDPTIIVHEPEPEPELHVAPVVNTVQEAFGTDSQELHNIAMDPLPEAHLIAQAALENKTGQGHSSSGVDTEKQEPTSSFPEESIALKSVHPDSSKLVSTERTPVQPEVHAPEGSSKKLNKNEKFTGDMPLEFQHSRILPYNLTASHVAEHGVKDLNPSPKKRKLWTPLEEDTLRKGVKQFGEGNWKTILNNYHHILENRTTSNLKDKWRNMIN